MPVVGRSDTDDIDTIVFEYFSNIFFKFRDITTLAFANFSGSTSTYVSIRVTDVKNLSIFTTSERTDVTTATTTDADDSNAEFLIRTAALIFKAI